MNKCLQLGLLLCQAVKTCALGNDCEFWKWQNFARNPACLSSPYTLGASEPEHVVELQYHES